MLPPITEAAEPAAEEAKETPEQEKSEQHSIKCAARDCKYNKGGACTTDISVSAGPKPGCQTYEPGGAGGVPMPPMPRMPGMM